MCLQWVESRHCANGRNGWKADIRNYSIGNMPRILRSAIVVACVTTLTTGATASGYERKTRCGGLAAGWYSLETSPGSHLRILNTLRLTKQGSLLWNQTQVSESRLRGYLKMSGSDAYPVLPVLNLIIDEGASCEWVRRVRSQVIKRQGCDHRNCVEYSSQEWAKLSPPPAR